MGAVDTSYVPVEREVKLSVNTSLHMLHAQRSQAAVKAPAALKTNLVVVTGYPTWYSTTPLMTTPITVTVWYFNVKVTECSTIPLVTIPITGTV